MNDHNWNYMGRFGCVESPYPVPGSGAYAVTVYDVYFCTKCDEPHTKRIDTKLKGYTTYGAKPWEGAWMEKEH